MSLEIERDGIHVRVIGGTATIEIRAEFDMSLAAAAHEVLERAIAAGAHNFDIDFCSTPFAGAPAIRFVLAARRAARARDGELVVRAEGQIQRMFDLTGVSEDVEMEECETPLKRRRSA